MEWWTVFLLLLCPLMMLFCMRGHSQGGTQAWGWSESTGTLRSSPCLRNKRMAA
ncbi:DUF2933 domain-containing protein [Parageobacillus thermoglucosidasius]|uniref:DUF2933 domain-containing protein n=1 Tax=Parageobacillus thermoglucosidasius TaxID=1426 RepID=UPI0026A9ECAD